MGYAVMGTATASGARRAVDAAQKAIASPLLEAGAIDGARGILINITGSTSLKLAEVQEACSIIQGAAHEDANIIFGAVLDEKAKDAVKITVIATGFKDSDIRRRQAEMQSGFVVFLVYRGTGARVSARAGASAHRDGRGGSRQMAAAHTEGVAVDTLRDAMIANFEKEDLDVPAFLRKRTEIS